MTEGPKGGYVEVERHAICQMHRIQVDDVRRCKRRGVVEANTTRLRSVLPRPWYVGAAPHRRASAT